MALTFTQAVRAFGIEGMRRADRIRRASALELFSLIITSTPVDTGLLRGNWQTMLNAPSVGTTGRLDKGGNAAIAEAMANLGGLTDIIYFTNNLPYVERIEYEGHSQQAPSGMFRKSIARWEEIVKAKARGYR